MQRLKNVCLMAGLLFGGLGLSPLAAQSEAEQPTGAFVRGAVSLIDSVCVPLLLRNSQFPTELSGQLTANNFRSLNHPDYAESFGLTARDGIIQFYFSNPDEAACTVKILHREIGNIFANKDDFEPNFTAFRGAVLRKLTNWDFSKVRDADLVGGKFEYYQGEINGVMLMAIINTPRSGFSSVGFELKPCVQHSELCE